MNTKFAVKYGCIFESQNFPQDATAPDPFELDSQFRLETLLGHLADKRYFLKDLQNGTEIKTARNETIKVSRTGEGIGQWC